MVRKRIVVGVCALCAFLVSGFAAQAASATTSGTTAFTCAAVTGNAQFKDAHCKETAGGTGTGFSHKEFTGETAITLTNAGTGPETKTAEPLFLHMVLAGAELEFKATEVVGTGALVNSLSEEVHGASGRAVVVFKQVTVVKPAGKGCVVRNSEIALKEMALQTVEGTVSGLKIAPKTGTTFGEIVMEGCTISSLNKAYPFTGSIIGTSNGATTEFTREGTTAQGTMFFGGSKMGLAGKVTIKGPSGAGLALTKAPFATG